MNYTQIGNVFRLCIIIEPFAALIWALGIVFAHIQLTQPAGLWHPSTLYTVVLAWYCTVQHAGVRKVQFERRRVGHLSFYHLAVHYLSMQHTVKVS